MEYLTAGIRLEGRVLGIYGGSRLAVNRIQSAISANPKLIIVYTNGDSYNRSVLNFSDMENIQVVTCPFVFGLLDDHLVDVLLVADGSAEQQSEIAKACRKRKILVSAPLAAEFSDIFLPASYRNKYLEVSVGVRGLGCALAGRIRTDMITAVGVDDVSNAILGYANLRQHLQQLCAQTFHKIEADSSELQQLRSQFLIHIAHQWSYKDLSCLMDWNMVEKIGHLFTIGITPDSMKSALLLTDNEDVRGTTSSTMSDLSFDDTNLDGHLLSSPESDTTSLDRAEGMLSLVGAGPGDPKLISVAAREALDKADLVIADKLVPEALLNTIRCEIRHAQKYAGRADQAQDELHEWIQGGLEKGLRVVRLKGGDPFVFGRGGEEFIHFTTRGFRVEVIPGISSALAAPLSAMIPVTHRGTADQVLIATARDRHGNTPDLPSYIPKRTVVLLMGVASLPNIVKTLLSKGYPASLPIGVIEKATWANQRTIIATLEDIVHIIHSHAITSPSTIVIGHACMALRQASKNPWTAYHHMD
eukprot:Clim_evm19s252 gene=Clim_evmTU19s252